MGVNIDSICRVLAACPHLKSSEVKVKIIGNSVVLEGTVQSYYVKQMAQQAILPLLNGMKLQNDLKVP